MHMPGMLHVGHTKRKEHKPMTGEEEAPRHPGHVKRGHPHLLGLGLPLSKRWSSSPFQEEWADYDTWGIDKRMARQGRRLGSQ